MHLQISSARHAMMHAEQWPHGLLDSMISSHEWKHVSTASLLALKHRQVSLTLQDPVVMSFNACAGVEGGMRTWSIRTRSMSC